jgi:phospholipid/cholesterol/gamma-HCH transport system substrate-binding protein
MQMRTIEIGVGAFVLAGFLALVVLVVQVSGVSLVLAPTNSHRVMAEFDDVAGLRVRSKVSMAGVTIGRVASIDVDPLYGVAIVEMEIYDNGPGRCPSTPGARILTEGILGARYIGLMPGGDDEMLEDGGYIQDTQGRTGSREPDRRSGDQIGSFVT